MMIGAIFLLAFREEKRFLLLKIYLLLFSIAVGYALICREYMIVHDYKWLLSYDTINYFIPQMERYIKMGNNNYINTLLEIFDEWDLLKEKQYFYFAYSSVWGVAAKSIGADLYFSIQLSSILIYSYCGVILYGIIKLVGFDNQESYRYAVLICLFSIVFSYSSQILRDVHVLLTYLLGIYITIKNRLSIQAIILLFLLIIITFGLRVESGIFMCLFVPLLFYSNVSESNNSLRVVLITLIFGIIILYIVSIQYNSLYNIYLDQYDNYVAPVTAGSGVIGSLQRIPVMGDILSIFYNAIQPWPFWILFSPESMSKYGGEAYNLMNLPRIFSSFLNYSSIVFIIYWLFFVKEHLLMSISFRLQLLLGFAFFYIQSAVIAQRRLMAYYCLYYIYVFMINNAISNKEKKNLWSFILLSFIILQIGGSYLK